MQVGTIENVGRPLQHGVPTGREIECHAAGGMVGRTGAKNRAIAHSAHRVEFRERRGDRREKKCMTAVAIFQRKWSAALGLRNVHAVQVIKIRDRLRHSYYIFYSALGRGSDANSTAV
jgi:hypothetical protein